MGGKLCNSHKGLRKGDVVLYKNESGETSRAVLGQYNMRWAEWYANDCITGKDFIIWHNKLSRLPKRFPLPNELFNDISALCERLKIGWFYEDYLQRKTISLDDADNLFAAWEAGFYDDCGKPYRLELTDGIRNLFREIGEEV